MGHRFGLVLFFDTSTNLFSFEEIGTQEKNCPLRKTDSRGKVLIRLSAGTAEFC